MILSNLMNIENKVLPVSFLFQKAKKSAKVPFFSSLIDERISRYYR